MSRRRGPETGAAAVEMAMVLLLLVAIIIGIAELGIAFRDWLSVSTATRSGVRVATAIGNDVEADCRILEATAGALVSVPIENIEELWIFQADTDGNPIAQQVYRPATDDDTAILECSNWVRLENGWPPSERKVGTDDLDIAGVRVDFTHEWITGFPPFIGTADFQDDAIMRMEPQFFGETP